MCVCLRNTPGARAISIYKRALALPRKRPITYPPRRGVTRLERTHIYSLLSPHTHSHFRPFFSISPFAIYVRTCGITLSDFAPKNVSRIFHNPTGVYPPRALYIVAGWLLFQRSRAAPRKRPLYFTGLPTPFLTPPPPTPLY